MDKERSSLLITKFCVYMFFAAALVLVFAGPFVIQAFLAVRRAEIAVLKNFFLVSLYTAAPFAFITLFHLNKLLLNIEGGQVFIRANPHHLNRVSWCCGAVAVICCVSTFYYTPFAIIAVAAAFVGMIVRVVKNVFEQAILLREEADYTI